MVKTKKRRTGKFPGKTSDTLHSPVDSPGGDTDNQHDDGDWIMVKKQRITILVPAAPLSERSLTADQEPSQMHPMPPVTSSNHVQLPLETYTLNPPDNEHEKTILLAAQKETHAVRRAPASLPKSPLANPSCVDQRIESENPHHVSILKSHSHQLLGVSNISKVIKQPRTSLAPRMSSNLATLNQGLRASNLERKLERAGGLRKWLTSLGLEQFVRIFQGKSISKYQLVNLTMKKLKDMGSSAVGPRRKLIHAIDCVCQPYCFEAY
ncbi:Sterile alpha motif domain [Sesbania bispinosa]|nr:Sterile alpha motif domain [Sesbania bispinosa]